MTKRYQPVPAPVARQHIADILSWLDSDRVLTDAERADYEAKIAAYRDRQAQLPFGARQ